jgi:tRNA modification GTPase
MMGRMPLPPSDDTISAIATAPGMGAIGIVRVSGPRAFEVAATVFRPASGRDPRTLPGGRATFGRVVDGDTVLDEAVLVSFRAPRSATGQDVVELQVHGGTALLHAVQEVCRRAGARAAGPGEFTLRAFLAGRIDLAQAESVQALVAARSDAARRHATLGLTGALSARLDDIQREITTLYAAVLAVLDYPEEGVPDAEVALPLDRAIASIDELLATARAGRAATQGARLALVGRPNAGKSSLLNALLGYERSIVSDEPGTTRDYLEAPLELGRVSVTAVDTAGLRDTEDAVEAWGVRSAERLASGADVVVALVDASRPLDPGDRELVARMDGPRTVWVASKSDLEPAWSGTDLGVPTLLVSARTLAGLPELRATLEQTLVGDAAASEVWVLHERHEEALREAREALERARSAPDDLRGLDLEGALRALGAITGRVEVAEETLAEVFARFCVGK